MKDASERIEIQHEHGAGEHRLAIGVLAGAALGVGVGLLVAPRKGSELRNQVRVQATHIADSASAGYYRAKDATGHYAHRGHDAYCACRDKVAHAAHESLRYVREVSDAVTMKSRRVSDPAQATARVPIAVPVQGPALSKPASPAQAGQPGRAREQASQPAARGDDGYPAGVNRGPASL
jgi:gas vesicle protein